MPDRSTSRTDSAEAVKQKLYALAHASIRVEADFTRLIVDETFFQVIRASPYGQRFSPMYESSAPSVPFSRE